MIPNLSVSVSVSVSIFNELAVAVGLWSLPDATEFIEHSAGATVQTWVSETRVNFLLAVFTMEPRGTPTLILFEAS